MRLILESLFYFITDVHILFKFVDSVGIEFFERTNQATIADLHKRSLHHGVIKFEYFLLHHGFVGFEIGALFENIGHIEKHIALLHQFNHYIFLLFLIHLLKTCW